MTKSAHAEFDRVLNELIARQESAWMASEIVSIEQLTDGMATSANRENTVLALICNEIATREHAGQSPLLAEYQKRFPDLANALYIQWEIDRLLDGGHLPEQGLMITFPKEGLIRETLVSPNFSSIDNSTKNGMEVVEALGRYELMQRIGRGSSGIVYEAWDPKIKRSVAIKKFRYDDEASPEELVRMKSEFEAIAKIIHPNIVQIFDVGENSGLPFMAMELCQGGSLQNRLNGKSLPNGLAAELMMQVAHGMAAAHACRVVHRDLKPANILLDHSDSWIPKITDFGLAKILDNESDATATGNIIGTPAYMAPEQAFGNGKYATPAVDIYSIGAVLYECLTGRPPFQGRSVGETIDFVRSREPAKIRRLNPDVPFSLELICLVCLRKDPFQRYATALELAEDLSRFLKGESIRAHQDTWLELTARTLRRNPITSGLLVATVVLLLVATIGSLMFANRLSIANQESIVQRDSAIQSKNRMRQALDAMTSSFTSSFLIEQKSISKEQRAFLREVLSYYREFLDETQTNEKSVEMVATAALRIAWIQENLGNRGEARYHFRFASENFERLSQRFPEDTGHLKNLALTLSQLASTFSNFGEQKESVDTYHRAVEVQMKLIEKCPNDPNHLQLLGRIQHNLGLQYRDQARNIDCFRELRNAVASLSSIGSEFPEFQSHIQDLAMAGASLGLLESDFGDWKTGQALLESSCVLLSKLIDRDPNNRSYLSRLSWLQNNFGIKLADHNMSVEAEKCFRSAIATLQSLSSGFPSHPEYQLEQAVGYINFAWQLLRIKRDREALLEAELGLQVMEKLVEEHPGSNDFNWGLGAAYHVLSDIDCVENGVDRRIASMTQCLRTWIELEGKLSDSATLYVSRLDEFRLAAAKASGLVPGKAEEYMSIAHRLTDQRFKSDPATREIEHSHLALLRTSRFIVRQAVSEAAECLSQFKSKNEANDWKTYYNLGCAHSLIAGAIKVDDSRHAEHVQLALDYLRIASANGSVHALSPDADENLKALHSNAAFKLWIAELIP